MKTVKEIRRQLFDNPKLTANLFGKNMSGDEARAKLFNIYDDGTLSTRIENNCLFIFGGTDSFETEKGFAYCRAIDHVAGDFYDEHDGEHWPTYTERRGIA